MSEIIDLNVWLDAKRKEDIERLIESSIIIGLVGFGITIYSIALGIKLCDLQKELKKKELEKEGVEK